MYPPARLCEAGIGGIVMIPAPIAIDMTPIIQIPLAVSWRMISEWLSSRGGGSERRTIGRVRGKAEDDTEDDSSEVARGADRAGHEPVHVRVYVREESVYQSGGVSGTSASPSEEATNKQRRSRHP